MQFLVFYESQGQRKVACHLMVSGFLILGAKMGKEFKTIEELVNLLESRNVITDENTAPALQQESYYAIVNGYKKPFLDLFAKYEGRLHSVTPESLLSDMGFRIEMDG